MLTLQQSPAALDLFFCVNTYENSSLPAGIKNVWIRHYAVMPQFTLYAGIRFYCYFGGP